MAAVGFVVGVDGRVAGEDWFWDWRVEELEGREDRDDEARCCFGDEVRLAERGLLAGLENVGHLVGDSLHQRVPCAHVVVVARTPDECQDVQHPRRAE